jgi:hypothetical protein
MLRIRLSSTMNRGDEEPLRAVDRPDDRRALAVGELLRVLLDAAAGLAHARCTWRAFSSSFVKISSNPQVALHRRLQEGCPSTILRARLCTFWTARPRR